MFYSLFLRLAIALVFLLINCSVSYASSREMKASSFSQESQFLSHQEKQHGRFYEKSDGEIFQDLDIHTQKKTLRAQDIEPSAYQDSMHFPNKSYIRSSSIFDLKSAKGKFLGALLLLSTFIQTQVNAYDPYTMEKARNLIIKNYHKFGTAEDRDVVLVIGNSQSGKTTLINRQLGCHMEKIDDGIQEEVKPSCIIPGADIGNGLGAETLFPQAYTNPSYSNYVYLDCPGYEEDRGEEYKIATAISTQIAVKKARNIDTVMIVINGNDFNAGAAKNFRNLIITLEKTFGKDLDKIPMIFVVNKAEDSTPEKVMATIKKQKNHTIKTLEESLAEEEGMLNRIVNGVRLVFGLPESLKNKILLNKSMLRVLNLISLEKIKIANVFDNSRKNCDEIENAILPSSKIPASSINFEATDEIRVIFDEIMIKMLEESIVYFRETKELLQKTQEIENEITRARQGIEFAEICLQNSDPTSVDLPENLLKAIQEEINKNRLYLEGLDTSLDEIFHKEKKLREEKKNLEEDSTDVKYWTDSVFEKRSDWTGLGFLSWTRKDFTYNGLPFSGYVESQERGAFSDRNSNNAEGTYRSVYKSNLGQDGSASVAIMIAKKDHPVTKSRISEIEKELNGLNDRRFTLSEEKSKTKKTLDSHRNQKREKIVELKKEYESTEKEKTKDLKKLIQKQRDLKLNLNDLVRVNGNSYITLDIANTLEFDPVFKTSIEEFKRGYDFVSQLVTKSTTCDIETVKDIQTRIFKNQISCSSPVVEERSSENFSTDEL